MFGLHLMRTRQKQMGITPVLGPVVVSRLTSQSFKAVDGEGRRDSIGRGSKFRKVQG